MAFALRRHLNRFGKQYFNRHLKTYVLHIRPIASIGAGGGGGATASPPPPPMQESHTTNLHKLTSTHWQWIIELHSTVISTKSGCGHKSGHGPANSAPPPPPG